jgi:hypothetical protein
MSSDLDLEGLRTEVRQVRKEANQNTQWILILLVIIACGGFGAVGAALSGLVIPALVIGAISLAVLAVWSLYRLTCALFRGTIHAAASWKNQTPAGLADRLVAIGLGLLVVGAPFIGVLLVR